MESVAVLASGGLDSSVLLADLARDALVFPLYVRSGLAWEDEEFKALCAYSAALDSPNVQPVVSLSMPVVPLYGEHWAVTGVDVPNAGMPDSAVFLPGRNVLLLSLAAVWCSTHEVPRAAIGSLGSNPFPDATPEFFERFEAVLSQGLAHRIALVAPYRDLHKDDLIRRNVDLPLHLTMTCMAPEAGAHCGACNKCHERQQAFGRAGAVDRVSYAVAVSHE